MTLTARDATGSGAGWHVTVQSTDFVYSGPNGGTAIPAARLALARADVPTMTAGQEIDATGGPRVPAGLANVTFDLPRTVLEAGAGFGAGTYTQNLAVRLDIPAQSRAGTYVGTLTTTMSSAP
jgi:hypothetical protein